MATLQKQEIVLSCQKPVKLYCMQSLEKQALLEATRLKEEDKCLIFLSILQLSFLCLASSVEIIQYIFLYLLSSSTSAVFSSWLASTLISEV